MKREFHLPPEAIKGRELWGFDWMEHAAPVPSPLMVVTGYKANGKPNATLQSWATFVSDGGYYCILASVNKDKHMYGCVRRTGQIVVNFPSAGIYGRCLETVKHNGWEDDEIALSALTAEAASFVDAPRIRECFMNLECEYAWEKEVRPGSRSVLLCARVVNLCMDPEYYDESRKGRFGNGGLLYNVHSPMNPETGEQQGVAIATLHVARG